MLKFKTLLLLCFLISSDWILSQNQWVHPINLNHDNDLVPSNSLYTLDCDESSPDFHNKYNRYQFYLDNYAIHPVVTIPVQFEFAIHDVNKAQLHIINSVKGVYFVNVTTTNGDIFKNRVLVNK